MSNNNYNRYGNNNGNGNRRSGYYNRHVNEGDVPESKHTVFVRGLPGHYQTDDIRDYINDKMGGKCTFDFVKVNDDKSRLFVAVRFETRDEAKEFKDKYSEQDFMGYECQLTWFKDIRRFAAYQQKSGIERRRREGYSTSKRRYSDSEHSKSRSRSRTRSPPSRGSSRSRSRSRSKSPKKDRKLFGDREKDGKDDVSSSEEHEKQKDKKKKKKKKRRYSYSSSSSEGEIKSDYESEKRSSRQSNKNREKSPTTDGDASPERKKSKPQKSRSPSCFIPPPSATAEDAFVSSALPNNTEIRITLPNPKVPSPTLVNPVMTTTYKVGINTEDPPRRIVKTEEPPCPPAPVQPPLSSDLPPPPKPPPITIKPVEPSRGFVEVTEPVRAPETSKTSIWERVGAEKAKKEVVEQPKISNGDQMNSLSSLPLSSKYFGHLADFQSTVVEKVKFVKKEEEDESIGTLKLSSFATESEEPDDTELLLTREERLGKLQGIQLDKFLAKKKVFEAAFKNDCETYAIVTNKLLAKDESLESSLRVAHLENVEELYKQFLERIDQFLTTIGV